MSGSRLFISALAVLLCSGLLGLVPEAEAKHGHRHHQKHYQHAYGKQYGHAHHRNAYYDRRQQSRMDYKTGKIIKGGLIGAGVGAGAGYLLDKPIAKSAITGGAIGAGTQAVRYSRTLNRHPIVKTAAYGALAGTGVSAATNKSLGKGALWGGAIGTGIGSLARLD